MKEARGKSRGFLTDGLPVSIHYGKSDFQVVPVLFGNHFFLEETWQTFSRDEVSM